MSADESPVLEPDTKALSALGAINGNVPDVALALLEDRMTPQRQQQNTGRAESMGTAHVAPARRQLAFGSEHFREGS